MIFKDFITELAEHLPGYKADDIVRHIGMLWPNNEELPVLRVTQLAGTLPIVIEHQRDFYISDSGKKTRRQLEPSETPGKLILKFDTTPEAAATKILEKLLPAIKDIHRKDLEWLAGFAKVANDPDKAEEYINRTHQ